MKYRDYLKYHYISRREKNSALFMANNKLGNICICAVCDPEKINGMTFFMYSPFVCDECGNRKIFYIMKKKEDEISIEDIPF